VKFHLSTVKCVPAALAVMMCLVLGGCGGGGKLAVHSELEPDTVLTGNFTTGVYAFDDQNNVDVILLEGPPEQPTQAVHIRMHWTPRAGRTPVDVHATNATVRYVIFAGEAAGVYSGSGFLFPRVNPGKGTFTGELRDTALRLADASPNFADRLGLARATGGFSAALDEATTLRLLRQIEVALREQLGYPRFVMAD
jgi:hypothetical protein